jgi:hypothetical protein
VITLYPIASTTLKWLMFKVVRWIQNLHYSALLNNGLGLFSIVGVISLHHIQSLAYVTMQTRPCSLLSSKNDLKALLA